jgi:hypothetical protein
MKRRLGHQGEHPEDLSSLHWRFGESKRQILELWKKMDLCSVK